MNANQLNVLAATMSAVAAVAALAVAWLSLRESRRAFEISMRERANALDAAFQGRLDPMYPDLRRTLGRLDDGVPEAIRNTLIPFFVLYSDAFAAHRDRLLDERDWQGFERELAYWAQKPTARRAWAVFRLQTWTEGFVDHVDEVLAGPPAYPDIPDHMVAAPEVIWDDQPDSSGHPPTP